MEDTAALRLQHRTAAGDPVSSVFHATNGDVENAPVRLEIATELARVRLDVDLAVTYHDGRVEVVRPAAAASGAKAYWGLSHGLLIDDFYRHVRAGKPFWIDAAAPAKRCASSRPCTTSPPASPAELSRRVDAVPPGA